jgi:hypothetical protein
MGEMHSVGEMQKYTKINNSKKSLFHSPPMLALLSNESLWEKVPVLWRCRG